MTTIPLRLDHDHLIATTPSGDWLVDTGAPTSFGRTQPELGIGEEPVESGYMGLDAEMLGELTGVSVVGLLGADILSLRDLTFDVLGGELTFGSSDASESWLEIPTRDFMGIPLLDVTAAGETHSVFFDTGAPISYLQNVDLSAHPDEGRYEDFYPGFGTFETETAQVDVLVGDTAFTLRVGQLPGLLGMSLMMGGVSGILGLEVIADRKACYSAEGGWLRLGPSG